MPRLQSGVSVQRILARLSLGIFLEKGLYVNVLAAVSL